MDMTGYSNYLLKDFELLQEYLQLELEESKTTDLGTNISLPYLSTSKSLLGTILYQFTKPTLK
jgi:hypothetical protein